MHTQLSSFLYYSHSLSEDADVKILASSLKNNFDRDITGFLHREKNYYVQYVEGPKDALKILEMNLQKDTRHTNFTILLRDTTRIRRFPNWSMGYSTSENRLFGFDGTHITPQTVSADELLSFMHTASIAKYQHALAGPRPVDLT